MIEAQAYRRLAVCAAGVAALAWAPAANAGWTEWRPASIVYASGLPLPDGSTATERAVIGAAGGGSLNDGRFIWACDGVGACPGDSPALVQFHRSFHLSDLDLGGGFVDFHSFEGYIQGDDYFAVYINGQLMTSLYESTSGSVDGWLDHNPDVRPNQTRQPVSFHHMEGLFVNGDNTIDIIACDGHPPSGTVTPSPDLTHGAGPCVDAGWRENRYLLFGFDLTVNTKTGITHNLFQSGTDWQVRAIPEPGLPGLLALAAFAAGLAGRTRGRFGRRG